MDKNETLVLAEFKGVKIGERGYLFCSSSDEITLRTLKSAKIVNGEEVVTFADGSKFYSGIQEFMTVDAYCSRMREDLKKTPELQFLLDYVDNLERRLKEQENKGAVYGGRPG